MRLRALPCQCGSGDGRELDKCSSYITQPLLLLRPPPSLSPPPAMHSLLSHQDQAAWFYSTSGPHFSQWRNDLLPLPLLLQSYNCGRTLDQLPPLTQASTSTNFFLRFLDQPFCAPQDISPSPSESSLVSDDGSSSSRHLNVVCNVPIVVPKPRPYRSLANLQFQFDLPSEDQDLSHPPYCTSRSAAKRKRSDDDGDADDGFSSSPSTDRGSKKRRAFSNSSLSLSVPTVHSSHLSRNHHGPQPVTRYTQTVISNQFRHGQPQGRPR